jgi:mannose-6-phosphate isomerase-like protein (cupin superfamily)
MTIDLNTRLAKFKDLVPSKIPFVEGKLEGHRDRLNYSVIGPGVSEDAKQNVKIAEAHGFNIGGVNAAPMNGSGLHSHTTAEVFLVYQGRWRFYWGVDGQDGEVFLNRGDVASFPTNMFRGFQNVGTDRGLLFVVLGENDPGVITWTPKVLSAAKDTGMVLMDDNTLVDTDKNKIPEDKKILNPLNESEIKTFNHYSVEDIEKCIVRFEDIDKIKVTDNTNGNYIAYIEQLKLNEQNVNPVISHHPGFNLGAAYGSHVKVKEFYTLSKHEVFMSLEGHWKIFCEDQEIIIGPKDIFSVPINTKRRFEKINSEFGLMYLVRE